MRWLWIDYALWIAIGVTWVVAAPFSRRSVKREPLTSRARFLVPIALICLLLDASLLSVPALEARWLPTRRGSARCQSC